MGENHQSAKLDKALYSDLVATSVGAIAGTSNVTTYVESAAGIGAGGRTGLTALVVSDLFCYFKVSLVLLLAIVPTAATAPILIVVGIMMLSGLKNIHWEDMSGSSSCLLHLYLYGLQLLDYSRDRCWIYHL